MSLTKYLGKNLQASSLTHTGEPSSRQAGLKAIENFKLFADNSFVHSPPRTFSYKFAVASPQSGVLIGGRGVSSSS